MSDDEEEAHGFMMVQRPRRRRHRGDHPIMPMAQAMELEDRWKRAQVDHNLQPGTLCVEKPGLGMFPDRPVMILWRKLDTDVWFDRLIMKDFVRESHANRVDCIIARLDNEANTVFFLPHSMELLEPYKGER